MKKFYVLALVLVFVMVAAVAFAGISTTKHNLTATGNSLSIHTTDTAATLCGFCHIPHGGNTSVTNAPLWGRQIRNTLATAYNVYGGGHTLANTTVNQPGTNSLTCLSCHDGTIALGVNYKNGVSTAGYTMVVGSGDVAGYLSGNALAVAGGQSYEPNIAGSTGNDLTNDHPVGLQYAGTGAVGSPAGLAALATATGRGFKFYGAGSNIMECASCHDPHTTNAKFKRDPSAFGYAGDFCVACHELK